MNGIVVVDASLAFKWLVSARRIPTWLIQSPGHGPITVSKPQRPT